jgi:carbamoyl-phosphate synthase small subunit
VTITAVLALEDGTIFNGQSIGAKGNTTGEVVFNTALTGYQEILSDPSYSRQIVTLTYPHIGNTGTTPEDLESPDGLRRRAVVRDVPPLASNWRKSEDLREFLARTRSSPSPASITRKLTRILREKGAQAGCIMDRARRSDPAAAVRLAKKIPRPEGHGPREGRVDQALVPVERRQPVAAGRTVPVMRAHQRLHVVAYDYGVKRNILRMLADRGCRMTVVPAQTLGRGSPGARSGWSVPLERAGRSEPCDYAIEAIRAWWSRAADLRHLPRATSCWASRAARAP